MAARHKYYQKKIKKNPIKSNIRKISQLFTYLKCTATKYLKKQVSNVTHKYAIINIIKK